MSGTEYPAWFDNLPARWTLIVEIQPDAEDCQNLEDRMVMVNDVIAAAHNFGAVLNWEWVRHDNDEKEI